MPSLCWIIFHMIFTYFFYLYLFYLFFFILLSCNPMIKIVFFLRSFDKNQVFLWSYDEHYLFLWSFDENYIFPLLFDENYVFHSIFWWKSHFYPNQLMIIGFFSQSFLPFFTSHFKLKFQDFKFDFSIKRNDLINLEGSVENLRYTQTTITPD